jgi:ABC-2 type transport system ATP-binding protein
MQNGCFPESTPVLSLHQVRKHFGRIEALGGLDLKVHAGEVVALLGPNGAGKTTAVRAALGLLPVDAGSISVLGGTPGSSAARLGLGVMLQAGALPETLTARELLRVVCSYYADPESAPALLADCGLEGLLDRRYGRLSGGQQRRVQLALALAGRPRLAILDEPTSALDVVSRQAFWSAIRQRVTQGLGVLLTTHDLSEVDAVAHRVVVISQGRALGGGSPAQVRARIAGSVLRFRSALSQVQIAAVEGVEQIDLDQQQATLRTRVPEAVLRQLLADDPTLCDLQVSRPSLEDAVTDWLKEAA